MIESILSQSVFLWVVNCAFASVAVCIIGGVVALAIHRQGPSRQHHVLLAVCMMIVLFPALQLGLARADLGWIEIARASTTTQVSSSFAPPLLAASENQLAGLAASISSFAGSPVVRPWVITGWVTGTLIMVVVLGYRLVMLWRLQRSLVPCDDDQELEVLCAAAKHIGVPVPKLAFMDEKCDPMVVGLFSPTIVISSHLKSQFTDQQWLCVLVHECAHIQRRDVFGVLVAELAKSLYWWNPLVIWAARKMDDLRERACDDSVISLGLGYRHYVLALLAVADWSTWRPCAAGQLTLLRRRHDLVDRVQRIQTKNWNHRVTWLQRLLTRAVLMAGLALTSVPLSRWAPVTSADVTATSESTLDARDVELMQRRNVSYLRVQSSSAPSIHKIAQAISDQQTEQSGGLIVDLRNLTTEIQKYDDHMLATDLNPSARRSKVDRNSPSLQTADVVVLVDHEDELAANLLQDISKQNVRIAVISPQDELDRMDHCYWQASERPAINHRRDSQLHLAIKLLPHV